MAKIINPMLFARIRKSDSDFLENALSDPNYREQVLQALEEYLLMWSQNSWLDEEAIFLLGKDFGLVCPDDYRETVVDLVRRKISGPVSVIFLEGFKQTLDKNIEVTSPPSLSELLGFKTRLERGVNFDDNIESDLSKLVKKYVAYMDYSGSSHLFMSAIFQICPILLDAKGPNRLRAAKLVQQLALEGIKWEAENEWLWGIWARGLRKEGAFEAAEFVYWDALRRFPWSEVIRSQLIQILRRQRDRLEDAVKLGEESFHILPESSYIAIQFALALSSLRYGPYVSQAIDILSSRLAQLSETRYEVSTLAAVLAEAEAAKLLNNDHLIGLVRRLRRKPGLLNALANPLLEEHKAFAVVQRIWRIRIGDFPNDHLAASQLAKAYAASGHPEDLLEAERILRKAISDFPEQPSLRNHLAKILAATGKKENRDEALRLLRETMASFPDDIYARNQLAETLASGGDERERQEAIDVARETVKLYPHDRYAQDILSALLNPPEVGAPFTQAPVGQPSDSEESGELESAPGVEADATEVLPAQVVKWGEVRRLRFRIENGSGAVKQAAVERIKEILNEDPTFAYAKLLAIRQGIWTKLDGTPPGFAMAFERALRDRDKQTLEMLEARFPRLAALTIVARAVFGDEYATAKIENLKNIDENMVHPAVRVLTRRIRPHLHAIGGGRTAGVVISESTSEIVAALHDASEATLVEPPIAA